MPRRGPSPSVGAGVGPVLAPHYAAVVYPKSPRRGRAGLTSGGLGGRGGGVLDLDGLILEDGLASKVV